MLWSLVSYFKIELLMEIRLKINSDLIGASASTLCTIHCLATPFFFWHLPAQRVVVVVLQVGGCG
jgi:hypothetical protein